MRHTGKCSPHTAVALSRLVRRFVSCYNSRHKQIFFILVSNVELYFVLLLLYIVQDESRHSFANRAGPCQPSRDFEGWRAKEKRNFERGWGESRLARALNGLRDQLLPFASIVQFWIVSMTGGKFKFTGLNAECLPRRQFLSCCCFCF